MYNTQLFKHFAETFEEGSRRLVRSFKFYNIETSFSGEEMHNGKSKAEEEKKSNDVEKNKGWFLFIILLYCSIQHSSKAIQFFRRKRTFNQSRIEATIG